MYFNLSLIPVNNYMSKAAYILIYPSNYLQSRTLSKLNHSATTATLYDAATTDNANIPTTQTRT